MNLRKRKMKEWIISNWLTIASIILSGLLSWLISVGYYRKGNRSNLQMNVLLPMIQILNKPFSTDRYRELCILSKNYYTRYLTSGERKKLVAILDAYDQIEVYDPLYIDAECLVSYFEYTMKRNKIKIIKIPFKVGNNIEFYEVPCGYDLITDHVHEIIKHYSRYDLDCDPRDAEKDVITLFDRYQKQYYSDDQKVDFFKDFSYTEVLKQSYKRREWEQKINDCKERIAEFKDLRIVQELQSL